MVLRKTKFFQSSGIASLGPRIEKISFTALEARCAKISLLSNNINSMDIAFLIGRILLGGYFIYSGYNHFANLEGMTGYAKSKNVPNPKAGVILTGLMLIVGGASILLGVQMILGMILLVVFLLGVTFMMHAYWKIAEPMGARTAEQINFSKNLALVGALLMMIGMMI